MSATGMQLCQKTLGGTTFFHYSIVLPPDVPHVDFALQASYIAKRSTSVSAHCTGSWAVCPQDFNSR